MAEETKSSEKNNMEAKNWTKIPYYTSRDSCIREAL
jgi:hypothetical protein